MPHYSLHLRAYLLFKVYLSMPSLISSLIIKFRSIPQLDGLAPEEIERTITQPVESSLRGIADVEQVRSITRFGLSQVTIVFKDKVDTMPDKLFLRDFKVCREVFLKGLFQKSPDLFRAWGNFSIRY